MGFCNTVAALNLGLRRSGRARPQSGADDPPPRGGRNRVESSIDDGPPRCRTPPPPHLPAHKACCCARHLRHKHVCELACAT